MGRCSDAVENEQGIFHGLLQVHRELQSPFQRVTLDQRLKPRLEDLNHAVLEPADDGGVAVDTHDVIAHLRQTGGRHEAHITGTHDADVHG
jgi:hypothetical protein